MSVEFLSTRGEQTSWCPPVSRRSRWWPTAARAATAALGQDQEAAAAAGGGGGDGGREVAGNGEAATGRVRHQKLRPGSYKLSATPVANGTKGTTHTTRFSVVS